MKKFLTNLLFKSMTIETIASLIAKCVVWLLEYARGKGDKYWDKAKNVIRKVNIWCSLFLEVYEDDELTEDEEEKIAEAIANETELTTIASIIKKKITKCGRKATKEKKTAKRVANKIKKSTCTK